MREQSNRGSEITNNDNVTTITLHANCREQAPLDSLGLKLLYGHNTLVGLWQQKHREPVVYRHWLKIGNSGHQST